MVFGSSVAIIYKKNHNQSQLLKDISFLSCVVLRQAPQRQEGEKFTQHSKTLSLCQFITMCCEACYA